MLKINLISSAVKKEIKLRKLNNLVIRLGWPMIFIVAALCLYFLSGWYVMRNQVAKNMASGIADDLLAQGSGQSLKTLNNTITIVDNLQAEYVDLFPLLKKITGLSNPGIKFTHLQISRQNSQAIFKGQAAARDDLLAFKKKLEESGSFQDIVLPISNLLLKENIAFEIKAQITSYEN